MKTFKRFCNFFDKVKKLSEKSTDFTKDIPSLMKIAIKNGENKTKLSNNFSKSLKSNVQNIEKASKQAKAIKKQANTMKENISVTEFNAQATAEMMELLSDILNFAKKYHNKV